MPILFSENIKQLHFLNNGMQYEIIPLETNTPTPNKQQYKVVKGGILKSLDKHSLLVLALLLWLESLVIRHIL